MYLGKIIDVQPKKSQIQLILGTGCNDVADDNLKLVLNIVESVEVVFFKQGFTICVFRVRVSNNFLIFDTF